jgi:hypothetical protein
MKKHILTIFIFISILTQTIAQVATVTGKITDAQTQKPIQGVSIRVKGKLAGTQTNANGSFSISLKTPASIVVTMIGYEAQTIDITNNQSINISLSPSNSELDPIVVTASRVEERILRSPVSIEKWIFVKFNKHPQPIITMVCKISNPWIWLRVVLPTNKSIPEDLIVQEMEDFCN